METTAELAPDPSTDGRCLAESDAGQCTLLEGHDTDTVTPMTDTEGNAVGEMRLFGTAHRTVAEWS